MLPIIPQPASVAHTTGELWLSNASTVGVDEPELAGMAARFVADVEVDTGLRLAVVATGATDIRLVASPSLPLAAQTSGVSPTGRDPSDEGYRLTIGSAAATVEGRSAEGVFRGLASLRQMIAASASDGAARLPAVVIDDAPRFAWRGLSLDVVRTFFAPPAVRRVIDVLALHKLNVLHLHLSDDQGWRIEIAGRPELTGVGAMGALGDRPGGCYTREDFDDLLRYAAERHVTIVPEIDMPGHAGAAIRAYPQLGSATVNVLDPDQPGVLELARDVVAALAEMTPGPFVHIGGDEAFGMDVGAYARFVDAARQMVLDAGKRPVLWQESARSTTGATDLVQYWMAFDASIQELLLAGDVDPAKLPEGMTIPAEVLPFLAEMVAASTTDVARAVASGARIILSPVSHVYLDRPYAEAPADPGQADRQRRLGLKVYPRLTVEQSLDWDPATTLDVGIESIAGVEAAIWCETLTDEDALEFMLLPRLPGVAERAWSPAPVSTWAEYRRRLGAQSPLWTARGWQFFASSLVDWSPRAH